MEEGWTAAQTLNENPYREFESLSLRHLTQVRLFSGELVGN